MSSFTTWFRKFIGNRRIAPRYEVQLGAHLLLSVGETSRVMPLEGRTRDISETGLALIVPAVQIEDSHLARGDYTLRIVLELPTRPVELLAVPVRYELVNGEEKTHYLLCAHITKISERDRTRFIEYLRRLRRTWIQKSIINVMPETPGNVGRGE